MSNRSSELWIVGFLFVLVYAMLFITRVPFSFTSVIWFLPVLVLIVTIVISIWISPGKSNRFKPIQRVYDQGYHKQNSNLNSVVKNSVKTSSAKNLNQTTRARPKAFFCHFCGTRRDINALFCHQCGTRLE